MGTAVAVGVRVAVGDGVNVEAGLTAPSSAQAARITRTARAEMIGLKASPLVERCGTCYRSRSNPIWATKGRGDPHPDCSMVNGYT